MKERKGVIGKDIPLLFACSGASKPGEIADLAARSLARTGGVVMSCPAAVSARIVDFMKKLKTDENVVVLDGCEKDCVARTMNCAGFEGYLHIRLSDIGLTEGEAEADDETVKKVVEHVHDILKKTSLGKRRLFTYQPAKDRFSK